LIKAEEKIPIINSKKRLCGYFMKKRINISPYLLILPAVSFILIVVAYPVLNSLVMSLQNYNLTKPKANGFVGLSNYITAFHDPLFYQSLLNTVIWIVFGVGFQFLFGFMLALLLNKNFKLRGFIRAIVLIPWVTPGVLIGLMWTWMYDGNYGIINDILQKFGIIHNFIPFLAKPDTALPAIIVTIVWQGIPFFAIMLLAGLQSIPNELYEAADVDGGTRLQKLFHITLPSIKNTIFITVMLRTIWVANSIDVIFSMTGGGPGYASQTLSVYAFTKAYGSLDFGYASTLSIILTMLLLVVAVFYLRNFFKEEDER
jgi:multiple sugar transport system permease protein